MTQQEIVDKVYKTFVTDKNKASVYNNMCVYGEPDTVGCAVACLCDKKTRIKLRKFELSDINSDTSVKSAYEKGCLPKSIGKHIGLLTDIQGWHDAAAENSKTLNLSTVEKKSKFMALCKMHNLKYPGDNR